MNRKISAAAAAMLALSLSSAACASDSAPQPLPAGSGVVCVNDFGAVPGDGKDDTAAVKKAFAYMRENGKSTLLFKEGQYDFFQSDPRHYSYIFALRNVDNVTVSGTAGKTTLMFHGSSFLVMAEDCSGLTFRDLAMDYSRPHFSLGTVTSVAPDKRSFEIDVDKDYPVKADMPVLALLELNPANNLPEKGISAHYVVSKVEEVAPQKLKISLKQVLNPPLENNARFLMRHNLYSGNLMRFQHCKDIVLQDLTVYSAPSMGAVAQYTTNFTVKNVKFVPSPERKNAPYSIASDGLSAHSCKGRLLIDGLVVDGNLDDGMNFYQSFYWTIRGQAGKRAAHLAIARTNSAEIPQFRPGDKVDFLNEKLQVYATRQIASCGSDNKEHAPLVEFTEDLPPFRPGIDLIVFSNEGASIEIRNSFFRSHRGRGITLQASNAVIENNRFDTSMSGIHLTTCLIPFAEAGPVQDVVIRNNEFNDCMKRTANRTAVIELNATLRNPFHEGAEGRLSLNGPHRNIKIIGNRINRTNNAAMAIASVTGCEIRGNVISDASLQPRQTWGTKLFWTKNAVTFAGARDVVFEDNRYTAANGTPGRMVIGEGCENLQLTGNSGFQELRENVIPLK